MVKIFLIIFSIAFLNSFSQQVVKIPLTYKKGIGKIFAYEVPIRNTKINRYKFDVNRFNEYVIKNYSFQFNQSLYNKYLIGEISRDSSIKRLLFFELDTINLSEKHLKNTICVFLGKDQTGHFFLIIDKNNNSSFEDDVAIPIKSGDVIDYTGEYEFYNKPIIRKEKIDIKLIAFDTGYTFEDSLENKWKLSIRSDFHKEGLFKKSATENIIFQFVPDGVNLDFKKNMQFIYFNSKDSALYRLDNINSFSYRLSDTFPIANFFYKIDSLNKFGDTAFLKKVKNFYRHYGWNLGSYIKPFKFTDQDHKLYNSKNKKFTLFEFWGTWCGPCVQLLPSIKKDVASFQKKGIHYYSFATEYASIENFNNYLDSNEIYWPNIYITTNNKYAFLLKNLKVISYPLFILKDNNDKIIFRDAGIDGYERLQKFISKKIK